MNQPLVFRCVLVRYLGIFSHLLIYSIRNFLGRYFWGFQLSIGGKKMHSHSILRSSPALPRGISAAFSVGRPAALSEHAPAACGSGFSSESYLPLGSLPSKTQQKPGLTGLCCGFKIMVQKFSLDGVAGWVFLLVRQEFNDTWGEPILLYYRLAETNKTPARKPSQKKLSSSKHQFSFANC